ncbi:MAG: SurA N-terminal domain-containing protein, partial [Wenzhouxiangellaceae bacterium]
MLQAIRDRVTGVVAIIILGLLAVPFVFFGLDSYIRDIPQDAVATVGESEITLAEFQTEFSRYRAQLRTQQGDAYNDIEANRPEARREFLDSMIDQRLLVNHAQQLGLTISPATLAEVIRNIPAFQVAGQFDPAVYEQRIQASGQSLPSFERELMEDLLVQELPSAVSTSAVVTDADIGRWLRAQLENRSITSIEIDSAPYRDEQAIEPAEVEQWYEQNRDQFMRPERVTVEYIELDTRDMVDTLEVEDEILRDRYEAVRDRYMTPERRRASHILIAADEAGSDDARARAAALRQQIEDGAEFETLAAENSDDPVSAPEGGDLGWIEPGVMMPGFEEALFELATGEISDPIETEFGWHIIRLDEIEPPRGQSFEEARAEILQLIREERAEDMYVE